jgi:hypothetical protein
MNAMRDVLLVLTCAVLETSAQLTPTQQRIMKDAGAAAVGASLKAERKLLDHFSSASFRIRLDSLGSSELLALKSESILQRLKDNLPSVEYTVNFGLDALSRKLEPGRESMDLDHIEKWGRIPTDWDMKLANSTLTANVPEKQWKIYDAAEVGLYTLPEFANPDKPTMAEIADRPKYIATNLRRMDMALQRYGAYAGVLRGDVVRNQAVFIGSDSGGWTGHCNKSVVPIHPDDRSWYKMLMVPCEGLLEGSDSGRPVLGVSDHQLHTIFANTVTFGRTGGDLARLMHQFLVPGATVRPLEVQFYTEAVFFGPLRMQELKVLVGSFPGLFGTEEGEALRAFCKKHQLPLAWGLGGGQMWPDEEREQGLLMPWQPMYAWPAGHSRLLDPVAGWPATNATAPADPTGAWDKFWKVAANARKEIVGDKGPSKDAIAGWWTALSNVTGSVPPLRAGDCGSADLCFGTYMQPSGTKDCVCRASTTAGNGVVVV